MIMLGAMDRRVVVTLGRALCILVTQLGLTNVVLVRLCFGIREIQRFKHVINHTASRRMISVLWRGWFRHMRFLSQHFGMVLSRGFDNKIANKRWVGGWRQLDA